MASFQWFCGNISVYNSLDDFVWDLNHTIYNTCFSNLLYCAPHLVFTVLASFTLFVAGCCTSLRKFQSNYLLQYPGHVLRWITNVVFMLLLISSLAEGILSDMEVNNDALTVVQLYVPACCAFLGGVMSIVYFHMMELWNKPAMSLLLALYWACSLCVEVVRYLNLENYDENYDSEEYLRFYLNVVLIAVYSLYLLLELNVIRLKLCCCCGHHNNELPNDLRKENMRFMQGYTNLLSTTFYWWLNWMFRTGYQRPLEMSDLGELPEVHLANHNRTKFEKALNKEKERASLAGHELSLFRVYVKCYGKNVAIAGVLKFFGDSLSFVGPVALGGVVSYATKLYYSTEDVINDVDYVTVETFFANGFVLVLVIFISATLRATCLQSHYQIMIIESIHLRAAIQASVYDKSLHLSSFSMTGGSMTMGQITNHMSVDAMNLLNSFQWVHYVWSIPYQIGMSLYILYRQLGYSALIGACVFLITMPMQAKMAKILAGFQKKIMTNSDERLKKTNEMLGGIKLLKLYGWEDIFYESIGSSRNKEVNVMMKSVGWRTALSTTTVASPLLVTLCCYGLYSTIEGKALTPDIAFASLSLINQMTIPLFVLPMTFAFLVNAYVSTKRLRDFYVAQEVEERDDGRYHPDSDISDEAEMQRQILNGNLPDVVYSQPSTDKTKLISEESYHRSYGTSSVSQAPALPPNLPDDIAIKVTDGSFVWDMSSAQPTLSNINVEIPAGKLTMIVGQVGSGKSSLLSAILGEMSTVSGDVVFNRTKCSVAYGAQKAWLLNATLKDNVLFGEDLDSKKYSKVIESCALKPDIEILPAGDQTEIGEKGINLSGGQKQRVSVARTIYSSGDIVILDDPLSALDVHVGKQLFEKGILDLLLKANRTVILVTHQVQYLEHAELILVMKNGMIQHQGSLEYISQVNPELYSSWQMTVKELSETEDDSEEEDTTTTERKKLKRMLSKQISVDDGESAEKQGPKGGKLIEKEERVRGSVSVKIYWYYMLAVRLGFCALVFTLAVLYNVANVGTNFWLSAWTEAGANLTDATDEQLDDILTEYLSGYAGLSVTSVLFSVASSAFALLTALLASKRMHAEMLYSVMHAPMRFFDTTPIGRILNRFSSDIQTTDMKLGQTVASFLRFSLACLSAIIVNAVVAWYFIVAVIPIFFLYLILMKFFITTSRELQRLDSISKSPVFAHFSESLGGLSTIRAYCQENRFRLAILKKIDRNNTAFIYLQTANRWLGIRLDVIGASITLVAGLSTMIPAYFGSLEPSLVGLAITYSLSMASQLNWVVRMSAEMEMNMNAVERINYYSNIKTENYEGSMYAPLMWPDKGHINMNDVSVRYAEGLDPVLQDINVSFKSAEKIGICGRTGSGKSSLTLALFRIIDTFKGSIDVDDVNIAMLPLTSLRRRIAIIPQDPVLFTGTVRFNLDPMEQSSDAELWEALEIAQMKDVVSDLEKGLDAMVTEGGENFSVGQRQLFCLARAFLRKTKILIMDEATASIDMETDGILQEVVATAFENRTVLTIAHRVSTILNSDRILVLSDGKVVEFDKPDVLLAREDSVFSSLVKANM